jgi:hypothetical protein
MLAVFAGSAWWSDWALVTVAVGLLALSVLPLVIVGQTPSLLGGIVCFGAGAQVFLIAADPGPLATLIVLGDLLLCWLAAQLGRESVRLIRAEQ